MKRPLKNVMREKRSGFTVIEAFVGISILLIGLVGPLMLVNSNLQAGRFSRDQITAYYLAQEAIEMVREERDENFLEGDNWLVGLDGVCDGQYGCRIDGRSGQTPFTRCINDACRRMPLQVNTATGQYGYGGGLSENSRFFRYVRILEDATGTEASVEVVVGFDTGRYIQEYTTVDYIRDWYPL